MLILNRRCGEAILMDGGIRIVVLAADRRGVRIGIEAPQSTNIQREELVLRVAEENRRAMVLDGAKWSTAFPIRAQDISLSAESKKDESSEP